MILQQLVEFDIIFCAAVSRTYGKTFGVFNYSASCVNVYPNIFICSIQLIHKLVEIPKKFAQEIRKGLVHEYIFQFLEIFSQLCYRNIYFI